MPKTHLMSKTTEYRSYVKARHRCNCPKSQDYKRYGGRGIEFRFNSFEEFLSEVGMKPTPQHTLDRIDVNGHYEKGNVRWATVKEQNLNTRRSHLITVNGETKNVSEWTKLFNKGRTAIFDRLSTGKYCDECAVLLPNKAKCPHNKEAIR